MSDYDSFLDDELEKYYEELEEDILDDEDSKIDVYLEQQENLYDGYE
jgi:hypothetical protein